MKHINNIVNERLNQLNMDEGKNDWLDNSKQKDFNEAAGNKTKAKDDNKNYSREEMYQKLNSLSKTARHGGDMSFMQQLKEKYEARIQNKDAGAIHRNHLFEYAKSKGLHQNVTLDRLKEDRAKSDQQDRNNVVKEAKQYYHRNYSLSKAFQKRKSMEKKGKSKGIDKSMTK